LAKVYADKVKWTDMDNVVTNLLTQWRDARSSEESFGDFCSRIGINNLVAIKK
jgi:sulfite reductase beta subunit-like hemoprotein